MKNVTIKFADFRTILLHFRDFLNFIFSIAGSFLSNVKFIYSKSPALKSFKHFLPNSYHAMTISSLFKLLAHFDAMASFAKLLFERKAKNKTEKNELRSDEAKSTKAPHGVW